MLNINTFFRSILSFIYVYRKRFVFSLIIIFVVLGMIFIPRSFAQQLPIKSIDIYSENSNYSSKESGAWKVTNSAKWIKNDKVRISFDVKSILKNNVGASDVLFVLDNSMQIDKLNDVKDNMVLLLDDLFANSNNRAGLISFNSTSVLQSDLTNNKDNFIQKLNSLTNNGDNNTNYYKALVEINNFLKNYEQDVSRNLYVVLIVGSFSDSDNVNSGAYYSYLKNQYPNLEINGIQYEMGNEFFSSISGITTNQFTANKENLLEVLFDMLINSKMYDKFELEEYLDGESFIINDNLQLKSSIGEALYKKDEQKVIWKVNNLKSGGSAKLNIDLGINENSFNDGAVVSTSKNIIVRSKLDDQTEEVSSELSPRLKKNYLVTYDKNLPSGCSDSTTIANERHSVFDSVSISDTKLRCKGYKFKGWKIVSKNVELFNTNYFSMPEEDVIIRGIWSKIAVRKSMDGKIHVAQTLSRKMADGAVLDDRASQYVSATTGIIWNRTSSDTNGRGVYIRASTKSDKYPVYYYRGNVSNNNVKFAGFCWKIVRTTATGGVKIIYNGYPDSNGKCTIQAGTGTQLGTSKFNSKYDNIKYTGYMYGNNLGENLYNSDIKTFVDNWYANNMTGYTSFLEDTPWCNDRTMSGSYFGEWFRKESAPTFVCPNYSDRFSVNSSNGNGALTYPTALLTLEEASLAGNCFDCYGPSSYLNTGQEQWLLSPLEYTSYNYHKHFYINPNKVYGESYYKQFAVRPMVSLNKDVEYSKGDGTPTNPYVIDTNS